jgi:hypothetical protein
MKFKDLKIGDRFYVDEFGWPKEIYTVLPVLNDESWNSQCEDGHQTDIDPDYKVTKLGPATDSDLGEAVHNYLKENLKIRAENGFTTCGKGYIFKLELAGEEISQAEITLKDRYGD